MIEVVKSGLQTTVQDYPGRVGMLRHGIPPSGPVDDWSFRIANRIVGNREGAAGLECQFLGPTLRIYIETFVSVCGANMQPSLDGSPIPMWSRIPVQAGQTLSLGPAVVGARAYVAFAGGIDVPEVMGARATYIFASLGGFNGRALKAGDRLTLARCSGVPGMAWAYASESVRPQLKGGSHQIIRVIPGPNDDWISSEGHELFYSTAWRLSSRSNRVGFRVDGPPLKYSEVAFDKPPEAGSDPSNTIDIGYPIGGINMAGDTPIILMHDCITLGGFIIPYTVPSGEFWKLGQARAGDLLHFESIDLEEAQDERRRIDAICRAD